MSKGTGSGPETCSEAAAAAADDPLERLIKLLALEALARRRRFLLSSLRGLDKVPAHRGGGWLQGNV